MQLLAYLYWNPPRFIVTIPFIDRPIAWYGVLFVTGFIFGYFIINKIFSQKLKTTDKKTEESIFLTDRLTWYVIGGTLIGARLGHVLFYDWPRYQEHLTDIFKIWEGGLASHGGAIGILIAIALFVRRYRKSYPFITFLNTIDMVAIPSALVGFFIRIGNFINQEILGTPTTAPWAVIFGDPADGSLPVPRHPVVLYEGFTYLTIFAILMTLWNKKGQTLKPGYITGLFFILVFTARFFWEFLKSHQGMVLDETYLETGQYLSLPFIALGFYLTLRRPHYQETKAQ